MGNVSQAIPSLHPIISIASPGTVEHSSDFATAAASDAGHQGLMDGTKALALTGVDLLADRETMARVWKDFRK